MYRNPLAYRLDSWRKALYHSLACKEIVRPSFRFSEAAKYVQSTASVLDICCGPCPLLPFLPPGVSYTGVDGSAGFAEANLRRGIKMIHTMVDSNLNLPRTDCLIMISSLYQFGEVAGDLLQSFKQFADKIIIVEDVLSSAINRTSSKRRGILARCYDYLAVGSTSANHYVFSSSTAMNVLRAQEFQRVYCPNKAYVVGVWDAKEESMNGKDAK